MITKEELYKSISTIGNELCFPFINNSEEDFLDYIDKKIQSYLELVKQLDISEIKELNSSLDTLPEKNKPHRNFDFKKDLKEVCDMVINVVSDSFRSYHEDAFKKAYDFFHKDECYFLNMLPQAILDERSGDYYRIRTDQINNANGDGELFHIPFEKRHLVSSMRFSIPGYPALYLGNNFTTAWAELNMPNLKGISFAKLRFKQQVVFLDLCYPMLTPKDWEYYSLFVFYPLLISCMVRVKYTNAPFKPEYIMPQIMLKIVREHGSYFSGIMYMSNKSDKIASKYPLNNRNLVVCVNNTLCKSGYDRDLASKMQMTDIHTITENDETNYLVLDNRTFSIDFHRVTDLCTNYHDITVPMSKD